MTTPTQPTPGSEWRRARQEGEVIRLPSGNFARVRPVALDRLILSGDLPDILTPIAATALWGETETNTIAEKAELARGYADLVNVVVPAAMMEPSIVDDPQDDGEIGIDDLEFNDKIAIFQLAIGGASTLKSFRERQEEAMASVPDSQDAGPATE